MGKGSSDTSASRAQSEVARELLAQTRPLRESLLNQYTQAFGGVPAPSFPTAGAAGASSGGSGIAEAIARSAQDGGNRGNRYGINRNQPAPVPDQQVPAGMGDLAGVPGQQAFYNPAFSPVFGPARNTLDQQFANARSNIIADTPEGGALLDRLADNEVQQATALGNLSAGIAENDLSRAIQLATGLTSGAQSGFSSAAQSQAAQAQANSQEKAGTGQALGTIAAAAIKSSDERIKENLVEVGRLYNGIPVYVGNYIGSEMAELFVLAQEVEPVIPSAVVEINGIKHVDHRLLVEGVAHGRTR